MNVVLPISPLQTFRSSPSGKEGMSLVLIMLMVAVITVVSLIAAAYTSANVDMSGHYRWSEESYAQALACSEYVKAELENDLVSGMLDFTTSNEVLYVNYPAPAGFTFDTVNQLQQVANPHCYRFVATGYAGRATTFMDVVMVRKNLLYNMGIFANELLKMNSNIEIFGYRSSKTPYPATPADSEWGLSVGANEDFQFTTGVFIDGFVLGGLNPLGDSPLVDETFKNLYEYQELEERVLPDPLGVIGGSYATAFNFYAIAGNNDNAVVTSIASNNRMRNNLGEDATFPPGNYYLADADIKGNIIIEGTPDNPVNIWLDGGFKMFPQAQILTPGGRPGLRIFSRSNLPVDIQPTQPGNENAMAFIYAPYADASILPNNDFYGGVWANNVEISPDIDFYVDLDLIDSFPADSMRIVSRKEIRDMDYMY